MNSSAEPVFFADGASVRVRVGAPEHHFRTPGLRARARGRGGGALRGLS